MNEKIIHLREDQLKDYESRLIAQGKNLKRYKTTIPCNNGHCSTRITQTTHCYDCFREYRKGKPIKLKATRNPLESLPVTHINPKTYTPEYLQALIEQAKR